MAPYSLADYDFRAEGLPEGTGVIGSGQIGGKGRGLFLVASLLRSRGEPIAGEHTALVSVPETLVLCSDVFEEFIRRNDLPDVAGPTFEETAARFAAGTFSEGFRSEVRALLGRERGPLAVRSSSLLEDGACLAFAGLYETVFIPNTGGDEARLESLLGAVRRVYASVHNPSAVAFRKKHGLESFPERMCVVVQPMVGSMRGDSFYPWVAGVAFSRNFYPWTERLSAEDGVVRLVYGLGTQAVGRSRARVFSPAVPMLRPEGQVVQQVLRYAQRSYDALDLQSGRVVSLETADAPLADPEFRRLCSVLEREGYFKEVSGRPEPGERLVLTFDKLVQSDDVVPLAPLLRDLLRSLERLLGTEVDIEFAVDRPGTLRSRCREGAFSLLQVRPLGRHPSLTRVEIPQVAADSVLVSSCHAMGNGVIQGLRHVVFVAPEAYGSEELPQETVRTIGRINSELQGQPYVLVGPGRWGSTNSALGVPADYAHISNAAVIVELSGGAFTPEFSYGTHFFGDLAADATQYMAVYPDAGDAMAREKIFALDNLSFSPVVRHVVFPRALCSIVDGNSRRGILHET
jgi:hypothetical protein